MDDLSDFIEGQSASLPDHQSARIHQHSSVISDVYYLLADEYLKIYDNHKAIRYYMLNLCYCPNWFDSWAGLALARSRIIAEKMNMRDVKSGKEILKYIQKQLAPTLKCFSKAVSLNDRHCYIMEKYGFFCYTAQSFASQVVHLPQLFAEDAHSWAKSTRLEMLKLSEDCFGRALDLQGTKHAEPWIYRMMLGKLSCKLEKPVTESLQHFAKSADILRKDRAAYPLLVELAAKNHAFEAIEVHYQLHSCALKFFVKLNSNTDMSENEKRKREKEVMDTLTQSLLPPLGTAMHESLWEWVYGIVTEAEKAKSSDGNHASAKSHVGTDTQQVEPIHQPNVVNEPLNADTMMDTSEPQTTNMTTDPTNETLVLHQTHDPMSYGNSSQHQSPEEDSGSAELLVEPQPSLAKARLPSERGSESDSPLSHETVSSQLLQQCLYGVAVCAVRCPNYFKAIYRLSSALLALGLPEHARTLLLGPLPPALLKHQDKLQPLFVLKGIKTPIFSNMWLLRSEEINRPGNFCTHARRNLDVLFEVLCALNESHSLLALAQHLKNKPDSARQYMRDNERQAMFKKAVMHALKTTKANTSADTSAMTHEEMTKLKSTAAGVKSLATKIDSLKEEAKALDEVIRALKKNISDMEASNSQSDEVDPAPSSGTKVKVKFEDNSSQDSQSSTVSDVTMSDGITSSEDVTVSQGVTTSEGVAKFRGVTKSQGVAIFEGDAKSQGATTSEGTIATDGITTSKGFVRSELERDTLPQTSEAVLVSHGTSTAAAISLSTTVQQTPSPIPSRALDDTLGGAKNPTLLTMAETPDTTSTCTASTFASSSISSGSTISAKLCTINIPHQDQPSTCAPATGLGSVSATTGVPESGVGPLATATIDMPTKDEDDPLEQEVKSQDEVMPMEQ